MKNIINAEDTTIICIDLQEKLKNMLADKTSCDNAVKLMKAASILDIDTIITEQYPKGLGKTINEISSVKNFKTIEKTNFSAFKDIKAEKLNKNIVIFGIETHICVYQTVLDLLNNNYNVFVAENCCASREKINHDTSLELMKQQGAYITTLEIVFFEFLKSSRHPKFKEVQALIK